MTKKEIEMMLDEIGIEYRYHHFEEKEAIQPPFICWLMPETDHFAADGIAYVKITELDIELYTDEKNIQLEEQVEKVLENNGIFFQKKEIYIETEEMYETLYEMEVEFRYEE